MKIALAVATSIFTSTCIYAQSPTPSPIPTPTPFDAMSIALYAPLGFPTPQLTGSQQAVRAVQAAEGANRQAVTTVANSYTRLLGAFSDDSAAGGLSTPQKMALFTTAQQIEIITNAWSLANFVNSLKTGSVPNPTNLVVTGS